MKEKDEINENNLQNNENVLKNNNIKDENIQDEEDENNQRTVSIQIDPSRQGQQRLMSLEEIIKLDVPCEITLDKIDESMNLDILIYNIKDFIIMLCLLLSSSFNFNYLYLPFIMIGIFYNCFILENKNKNRNIKFILEIIILIYSILLAIFKIIILIIFVSKKKDLIEQHKNKFIDLGIYYFISNDKKHYKNTFIGESLIFIFSLGAIIVNKIVNITDEEIENRYFKKMTFNELFTKMRNYLFTCFFILSGIAIFNKSILSLIYVAPMCIFLFLYSLDFDKAIIYNFFRIISKMLLFLLIIEVLIINITNFYTIYYNNFFNKNEENNNLIIWKQLGFLFIYYKENELEFNFGNWLGYFFSCLTIVTFSFSSKSLSRHELQIAKKDEKPKEKEEKDKTISFFDRFALLWINPYFILHICRILAIIWLYIFRNFYSLGIFIWLYFSFLYLHITSNDFWTKILLIPFIFVSLFSIHISRIEGSFENFDEKKKEKYFHFALGKYDYDYLRYFFIILFYFFANYFLYTLSVFKNKILSSPLPSYDTKKIINNLEDSQSKELIEGTTLVKDFIKNDNNESNSNLLSSVINLESELNIEKNLFVKTEDENKKIDLKNLNIKINNINIDEDENLKEEELEKITLYNLFIKYVIKHIDKLTLISLYIVAFNGANIIHIIVFNFILIQLLLPEVIKYFSTLIIQIFQILYLIEYILDLTKAYHYNSFSRNINNLKIFLPYSEELNKTSIEIFIYFSVYCFYAQYQFYNCKEYKDLEENGNINIKNFIHKKLSKYHFIEEIFYLIGIVIVNIYIWLIIILFILSTCLFESNLLFGIELCFFFISLFFFMKFIQEPKTYQISIKKSYFLLLFSGSYTFAVYIYQVIYLIYYPSSDKQSIGDKIDNSKNFFFQNLPNIGFTKYDENKLYTKLFPHFLSNFVSLLLYLEIKRSIKINEKIIVQDYKNKIKAIKNEKNEDNKEKKEQKKSAAKQYQENLNKMSILELKNIFFNIMIFITKFYWIFLFLVVCILFTTKFLSFGMIIYLIIFGLTFILSFYNIVNTLTNFIKKESYFISKLLRYSLIETKSHIKKNASARKIAFHFLFGTNCIFLSILYLSGVFYLFENGCNPEYWKGCNNNHHSFFSKKNKESKDIIISILYLFGFYVDLENNGILSAAWADLLLFFLIGFDVYIQKLEHFFTNKSTQNRIEYKILANENIKLKPLAILGQTNILANIEAKILKKTLSHNYGQTNSTFNESEKENELKENKYEINNQVEIENISKDYINYLENKYKDLFEYIENMLNNKKIKLPEKEKYIGKKSIMQFLEIFQKASSSDVKLSESHNKYKIIKGFKQIYEEIIIYLLICTAIVKLNIWSFIYMLFSLFLILTKKSIKKYYFLLCFLIAAIIFQNSIFVSNIRMETDPGKSQEILDTISNTLKIPWYKEYTDDKNGFFLGLGVNRMQINLMWMDYVETIIIYIYLSYFTYSIYQDVPNKGTIDKGIDKINYYNLTLNRRVKKSVEILTEKEFQKHQKCMKYDFNIDIGNYEDFKCKILLIKPKNSIIELKDIKDNYNTVNVHDITIKDNKPTSLYSSLIRNSKGRSDKESPLLEALRNSKKLALSKKNLINKSIEEKIESERVDTLKKLFYLSSQNIILIIIMIISMMVSGLLSIFYIIFSLIFLMKSNAMYYGKPYYYPKAVKTFLRVAILIDIAIQALYQTPYINPNSTSNNLYTILKIIGFNKIISFGNTADEFKIYKDQMILVLGKSLTYFFISLQILIYSSQDFQEYYLSYLLTKKNNMRRISLMNVFRFNNKRIKTMGKSITLRQEMDNSMQILQKRLELWSHSLLNVGGKLYMEEKGKNLKNKISENLDNSKDEIINFDNKIKKSETLKTLSDFPENEVEEGQKDEIKSKSKILSLFGIKTTEENIKGEEDEYEEEEEEKEEKEYVSENIVKENIKSWIFGGFLMKIQLWLHKNAASYNSIEENERDVYEKEIIQGRTAISSILETTVEMYLNTIDLSKFTLDELTEVKKFFDGTREKELKEMKKKKIKIEKRENFKKHVRKVILSNNIKKLSNKSLNKNIAKKKIDFKEKENKKVMKDQDNKKNKIDLNQKKFKDLEELTSNELFVKYLKTTYIIKCILSDIMSFCSNQFHWLCYIMMIIDHMSSPSLLSLFYPLSIFLYAILEYPRPTKTYWSLCLLYTVVLISLKFIIQLQLFVKIFENKSKKENPYIAFIEKLQHYKLGPIFFNSTFSLAFFEYIVYDSLVIIFLLLNNYLLLSKGIWMRREHEIENIYQAMERIASTKHLKIQSIEETKRFNFKWLYGSMINNRETQGLFSKKYSTSGRETERKTKRITESKLEQIDEIDEIKRIRPSFYQKIKGSKNKLLSVSDVKNEKEEQMKPLNLEIYNEINRTYFQRLFPKIRNEKPGNNYYSSYTITMLFIIIFLILFFTNMNQDKTFNSVSVDTNQFSSTMVLFLLVHIFFIFYDRVIYINQNRSNLTYDYIIYDKQTCNPISEVEFNRIKSEISLKFNYIKRDKFVIPSEYIDEIQDNYNIVYIQNEDFNYPLLQKYILHFIITIFSHGFVFFYLPIKGNINIANSIYCIEGEDCNDFIYNPLLIIFYILYVIYLIGSGLQVKYGFFDLRRKSLLKKGNSSISGAIFSVYKAIPFLYEIKSAIDWTFTSTCLDFFQWNKFESVYDSIYLTYCTMTAKNAQLIGQKVKKIMKIGMGGTLSFTLILLLVIPIMLFSSLNPTNELNNLTGATLKIDLSMVYQNGASKNYTLFENSKPESIKDFFPDYENDWEIYNYDKSIETKNFPQKQIQKIEFFEESDRNWGLAKPHIRKLKETLKQLIEIDKIYISMDYTFERPLPAEAKKASNRIDTIIFDEKEVDPEKNDTQYKIIENIRNVLSECNENATITFKNLYSVPLRLTANVNPGIIIDEKYDFNFDVTLGFIGCEKEEDVEEEGKENGEENGEEEDKINYLQSYFTLKKINKSGIPEKGLVFHTFSDKASSSTSGYSVLTFYVSFVLLAGTYVRNFFSGEAEKVSLTEMPNPEDIINLCEGVLVSRYSFDYDQEEKLYYILIELMRSPDYLKILTKSSIEQYEKRRELTQKSKATNI